MRPAGLFVALCLLPACSDSNPAAGLADLSGAPLARDLAASGAHDLADAAPFDLADQLDLPAGPDLTPPPLKMLSFGNSTSIPVGTRPQQLVAGDWNQDGHPDLATVNVTGDDVSLLLGRGDGSFKAAISVPLGGGSAPLNIVTGDFNSDQRVDLAVTGATSLFVLLNNGNGAFAKPVSYASGDFGVVAADLNDDGRDDIATVVTAGGGFHAFFSNANGTLQTPTNVNGTHGGSIYLAAGDLDGDGRVDLAVGSQSAGGVVVHYNLGNGSFGNDVVIQGPLSPGPMRIADIDRDGARDIVAATGNMSVIVLGNLGAGRFTGAQPYPVENNAFGLGLADFDRDGFPDIAVSVFGANDVDVLRSGGGKGFAPAIKIAVGTRPQSMAIADFNGDGLPDIAVINTQSNDVSIILNTST